MFGIGMPELLIIMLVILLLFGAKKLPELAQGLGKGIREFKKASNDIQEELDLNAPPKTSSTKKVDEEKKDNSENNLG
ncbi:MAG: twin-arginine translocase TatA/TatE family subunit [Calditrichaceae bacterium]|nr:twin-arginine translocase TatA/TatE family subunit [Calditrichaceae bacterium]MBN2709380.1 twin-arginine translocase TatA/TatE family subunit [Calditrichaceae bacterium]RQV95753.1 MAG: twin-arginine translocase TatA/TatE family subunit [Calditrichota bacterium]